MKKYFFLFFALAFYGSAVAQNPNSQKVDPANPYQFSIDLTKIHSDLLSVNLTTPAFTTDTAYYRMPAIVPGTYKVYNFGKFVSNFHAFDKSGKEITVVHSDVNTWKIPNAKNLDHLSYDVEDTWDSDQKGEVVFEPAGTNFQVDSNFVLNNHAIFGYFDGMKKNIYKINITHPNGFYGSTGLSDVTRNGNKDIFSVPDYMQLVDGPIMYDIPDTTHILLGGADILVSVYSPNHLVSSKFVADSLRILLDLLHICIDGVFPEFICPFLNGYIELCRFSIG